ncbi:MAG: peptide ABC transporter substrate-binding protein [Coriobacteriia bacterium]|nr:peptide ABC transporter substrate-binding protein [Coriobacteriia bacterium]
MQGNYRKAIALMLALGLVAAVGAGCAPKQTTTGTTGGETTTAQKGGTLAYYLGDAAYIDPYNMQESEGTQVGQAIFDSLTAFDPLKPENVIPAAAESWTPNADGSVWTFVLNKNGKFADGTPVKASDFIYSWNRIANPKTKNTLTKEVDPSVISYHLMPVKGFDEVQAGKATEMSGLKAIDDYTLEVTLSYAFADFPYVVGHPALAPVPQKYVDEGVDYNGTKVAFGDMPVGNGPFKMSEPWKHDQYIKVVRNDEYYGEKPLIDGIDFRIFKDPNTAFTEFEAGTLDFAQIADGKIKETVAKFGESENGYTANPGKQALLGAENATYYLVVNLKKKEMQNENLRKAISLAINRAAICELAYEGTRDPADNIVPPGIAGYEAGAWPDAKYDLEAAKTALADAGFPEGKGAPAITITYNNDGGHEKIMQLVQSDLKAIGLTAKFDTADFPNTLKKYDAGNFQIGRLGWVADYPIMDNFLFPLFTTGAGDNKSSYSNKDVDQKLKDARSTTDSAARIALYQEADKVIGSTLPVIPVVFYKHHHVASDRVNELTYSAMGLADFQKVWLSAAAK